MRFEFVVVMRYHNTIFKHDLYLPYIILYQSVKAIVRMDNLKLRDSRQMTKHTFGFKDICKFLHLLLLESGGYMYIYFFLICLCVYIYVCMYDSLYYHKILIALLAKI